MLDEFKQFLGRFANKNPEKFGKIKQIAKDMGVSTEDVLANSAEFLINQQSQQTSTNFNETSRESQEKVKELESLGQEIQSLREEIAALAEKKAAEPVQQPQQPQQDQIQQATNQFSAIESFAKAMGSLRSYENTVIDGYKGIREEVEKKILENMPEEEDLEAVSESPEDYALKL